MSKTTDAPAANGAPKIRISRNIAAALRAGMEQTRLAEAAAAAAKERYDTAQNTLQAIASTHQAFLLALIQDAGMQPDDFRQFGFFEEHGEVFLRPLPSPQLT